VSLTVPRVSRRSACTGELAGFMEYPNVKNAHIVPRTYLANWAIDGKIAVWLVPENRRLHDQPVENVGTRRRFYERVRPVSGEKINDIEAMLGVGEAKATPLFRSFGERWPLPPEQKVQLAELFGYELLRGPRWKAEYEERTQRCTGPSWSSRVPSSRPRIIRLCSGRASTAARRAPSRSPKSGSWSASKSVFHSRRSTAS
jgi:hypothetical protein